MSLSGESGSLSPNISLARLLEKIRGELGLSQERWCDYLKITQREYARILSGRKELSAASLFLLSDRLELNPTNVVAGTVSLAAIGRAHRGEASAIDPRFMIAAFSRKFTVVNTLNFIEKRRGSHLRGAVNRHFQVKEDYWQDWQDGTSQRINIQFLCELWSLLRKYNFTDKNFFELGLHSSTTLHNTYVGKALSAFDDVGDAYEYLFSGFVETFERNHVYRIQSMHDGGCVIECRPNPDVSDALSVLKIGTVENCQVKNGIIASISTFLGHPPATVHETQCIHTGASYCKIVINYSDKHWTQSPNQPSRLTLLS